MKIETTWDQNSKLFKTATLSKAERIQLARDEGLNVLEYLPVTNPEEFKIAMDKFNYDVSIRCEPGVGSIPGETQAEEVEENLWGDYIDKEDGWKWRMPPHFPRVTGDKVTPLLESLIKRGWHPIVSNGLAFSDNLISGTISMAEDNYLPVYYKHRVEIAIGPGVSVRDVTHGSKCDLSFILEDTVGTLASELKSIIYPFRKQRIYIEWGYEARPVGWKHERIVIWEIHILQSGDDFNNDRDSE